MNPDLQAFPQKQSHAVVIGGSIVGCMAAKVLARDFDRVTVIEKGDFDDEVRDRRGVPQEKHVHLLLLRGKQILEEIFPGITTELEQAGALSVDLGHGVKCFQYGQWRQRFPSGVSAHYCSRRLIDNLIRRRLRRNARIEVQSDSRVVGLHFHPHDGQLAISGVKIESAGQSLNLPANLVIDASGRGSRMAEWLAAAGLGEVPKTLVETRLGYTSRIYRQLPAVADQWKVLLVLPKPPNERRMGVISPIEHGRWLVTTGGWFGEYPKPNEADFLAFLKSLPATDIYNVIRNAEPLSEVSSFAVPGSLWRHYEQMPHWPDGLLVMGDALCCLNPLYSQGMTICALEAKALRVSISDWLAGRIQAVDIQRHFADAVNPAWGMATSEDLRFPETVGDRDLGLKWRHWYGARFVELSATHRLALQTQIGITNLVVPARQLYRPEIVGRIAYGLLKPRALTRSSPP
ncbi:FAD-dependent oxidoreductase [Chitinivorax sp. B]|uniref:NAD(P)/FAD-dependent oxidoreductase n=1 Tax=Chitinivorax sp. B TaxID=2502235 RepID=UPI0010F6544E|nr:FAD-dependent oxidoreductase [Chitinivorax sp. B]